MSRKLLTKFVNRNPRNLEMMGLQAPPTGYDLEVDRQRRSFIYKANLVRSKAHTEAQLIHYRDGLVLSASTKEKSISSQLYSNVDASAAANLGTVLALRCLMSGIHFAIAAHSEEDIQRSLHLKVFYDCLMNGGVTLGEPPHIEHTYRTDRSLVYDSYEVHHTREDKTDE